MRTAKHFKALKTIDRCDSLTALPAKKTCACLFCCNFNNLQLFPKIANFHQAKFLQQHNVAALWD